LISVDGCDDSEQLDAFVMKKINEMLEEGEKFEEVYPNDWKLLKGFDRAFWY
jgi:hypothetical protein